MKKLMIKVMKFIGGFIVGCIGTLILISLFLLIKSFFSYIVAIILILTIFTPIVFIIWLFGIMIIEAITEQINLKKIRGSLKKVKVSKL